MTNRHGAAVREYPSELEIVTTRRFDAPIALVFDVLTKPEHVRLWFGAKELEVCEIDFRVGGKYHFVGFVMDGDTATCSFRGTYREIERLRAEPAEGDIAIGGAALAAEAAALGLIDEYRARVYPVLVGGGIPFFPQRERRVDLELVETRTFSSRVVYLHYRVAR